MTLKLTINSRVMKQKFEFWVRISDKYGDGYIYLVSDTHPGTLGQQICDSHGNCLIATPDSFERVCRKWYRAKLRSWQSRYAD